jgi:PAS domain S-box-containing protein
VPADPRPPLPDLGDDLRAFCARTGAVLWVYDLDKGALVFVNEVYETLWGRPRAALYAHPDSWLDGVHGDDRARVLDAVAGLRVGRYDIEYRVRRPDDSVRWVRAQAVSFTQDREGGQRVVGIIQDVTDARALSDPLQRLADAPPGGVEHSVQALLEVLVEVTGADLTFVGMRDGDTPGRVRAMQARTAGGRAPYFSYELAGSPCTEVFAGHLRCHPRDLLAAFPHERFEALAAQGYLGVPLASPEGEVLGILVAVFAKPIADEAGACTIFRYCGERAGTAFWRHRARESLRQANTELELAVESRTRELAEANKRLRTSEERYRLFVEGSPVGIWCVELSTPIKLDLPAQEQLALFAERGRVVECNQVVARRLGLDSAAELIGLPVNEVPTFWNTENQADLASAIQHGYRVTDAPRQRVTPSGETLFLRFDVVGVIEHGALRRLWCTERDDTARVEADERVTQHQNRLAHFSRLNTLGEMASGIAHELNQPLGAIANYASGITRRLGESTNPEVLAALRSIAEQAARAGATLQRLRAFARPEPSSKVSCSARKIVHAAVQLIAHRQRACAVEVELSLGDEGFDDRVLADAIQVEQVVLQLLRNAYDSLDECGGPERRVILSAHRTENGLEIRVQDSGPGLPPGDSERVFLPFHSSRKGGIGLGLTVSRSVVEDHGGRLWHTTPKEGGAAFHFTLIRPSSEMLS